MGRSQGGFSGPRGVLPDHGREARFPEAFRRIFREGGGRLWKIPKSILCAPIYDAAQLFPPPPAPWRICV
jgi:hypothetical protein